jgi:hypothetical protein
MKYIITENKLNNVALSWMNKNFGLDQLEIVESEKYPNSVFFRKNGKVVMMEDKKFKFFWFDYDKIWSFFESFFGMEYLQIQDVLNYWLEDTFKLEGYTPASINPMEIYGLEDTPNERLNESDEPKHKTVTKFERMLKPALEMLNKMSEGWDVHNYTFDEMSLTDGETTPLSYETNLHVWTNSDKTYNRLQVSSNLLSTMEGFFPLIDEYVIMDWFNEKYNRTATEVEVQDEEY